MAPQLADISRHGMESPPGDDRLGEAIIYVANGLENDPSGRGAVKLNKVLWWADFESFRERGCSVTGSAYQRLSEGPAPVSLLPVRKQLEKSAEIKIEERSSGASLPEQVVCPRRSHRPVFDSDDLSFLDRSLAKFRGWSGNKCSEFSHRVSAGWQSVDDGQIIPYETALVDTRPVTDDDRAWARSAAVAAGFILE